MSEPTEPSPPAPRPPSGGTRTRLISGLTAFVIVLPILALGDVYWVGGLGFVAALICMYEFTGMALPSMRWSALGLMTLLGLPLFGFVAVGSPRSASYLMGLLLASVPLSAWLFLFTAKTTEGLADRWARFMLGLLYVPLLLGLFPGLRGLPGGRGWLWVPLLASWGGDIGGYFAGRAFGKHKMSPLISPKKTWEGFAGGLLLAVLVLILQKLFFFPSMLWLDCLVLGPLAFAAGVVGDFVESMVKRTYGVKDSGTILPGHGGMLDRIDSVIMALPVVYTWVVLVRPHLL